MASDKCSAKILSMKICKICSIPIPGSRRGNAKTCSTQCSRSLAKENSRQSAQISYHRNKKPQTHPCLACRTLLTGRHRYCSNAECQRIRKDLNQERIRARRRENKVCHGCGSKNLAVSPKSNRTLTRCLACLEKGSVSTLRTRYGLTPKQLQILRKKAGGCCQCCGRESVRLVIDHKPGTKEVRGLVCDTCNHALHIFDNANGLKKRLEAYHRNPPARSLLV